MNAMNFLIALVVLSATMLAGCAGGLAEQFRDVTRADVQRSLEIATAANDAAGAACAETILKFIPEDSTVAPAPTGALSAFMAARELRRKAQAGIPDAIHNACAVLILDAEMTLAKLGLAVAPGGGLIRTGIGLIPH